MASNADQTVYVEARLSQTIKVIGEQRAVNNPLEYRLQELAAPYMITFEWKSQPPPVARIDEVAETVTSVISAAIADDRVGEHGRNSFFLAGTEYTFRFDLTEIDERGIAFGMDSFVGDAGDKLFQDIKTKVGRYELPDAPYVIAIWPSGPSSVDESILNALYGTLGVDLDTLDTTRKRDGLFNEADADGQPANAEVSAVLIFTPGVVTESGPVPPKVFHNPNADQPLAPSVLCKLNQYVPTTDETGRSQLEPISPGQSPDWPSSSNSQSLA